MARAWFCVEMTGKSALVLWEVELSCGGSEEAGAPACLFLVVACLGASREGTGDVCKNSKPPGDGSVCAAGPCLEHGARLVCVTASDGRSKPGGTWYLQFAAEGAEAPMSACRRVKMAFELKPGCLYSSCHLQTKPTGLGAQHWEHWGQVSEGLLAQCGPVAQLILSQVAAASPHMWSSSHPPPVMHIHRAPPPALCPTPSALLPSDGPLP